MDFVITGWTSDRPGPRKKKGRRGVPRRPFQNLTSARWRLATAGHYLVEAPGVSGFAAAGRHARLPVGAPTFGPADEHVFPAVVLHRLEFGPRGGDTGTGGVDLFAAEETPEPDALARPRATARLRGRRVDRENQGQGRAR